MRAIILSMLLTFVAIQPIGKCQTCRGTGWVNLNFGGGESHAFSCMWCVPSGRCPTPLWHLQQEQKHEAEKRANARSWLDGK